MADPAKSSASPLSLPESTAATPAPTTVAAPSPVFHDLKPVPEFHPIPWLSILTAALLAATVLWFFRFRKRRGDSDASNTRQLTPLEAALEELARLELLRRDHRITLRDLSSQASLALRVYLEKAFEFPAAEQTAAEVSRTFPRAMAEALPELSTERVTEIASLVKQFLRFLERTSFAGDSTERYHLDSPELTAQLVQAEALVRRLDTLREDAERRRRELAAAEAQ